MSRQAKHLLEFGPFRMDLEERVLIRDQETIPLSPKAFETLLVLVQHSERVVLKDDLMKTLWPDTFVEESNLSQHIFQLRKALGEMAHDPQYIVTVPGRGYRFALKVAEITEPDGDLVVHSRSIQRVTIEEASPPWRRWVRMTAGGIAALSIVSGAFWFATRQFAPKIPPSELKLRQLTTNPSENVVSNGAISPDGKYLAYVDTKGIQIKLIETGETRAVPPPEGPNSKNLEWRIAWPWFPDSTRFLAESHPPGQAAAVWTSRGSSIWIVSLLAGPPHKLRDEARADSISPDGSTISFGTNRGRRGDREIWLMGPDGENARKLYEADEDSSIGGLHWFPHGQRVWYGAFDKSGFSLVTRELGSGPVTTIPLPPEVGAAGFSCNYWALPLDERTGAPTDKPKRLTNWGGTCPIGTSITAEGRKLAFLNWGQGHAPMVVTDLEANGKRVANTRSFASSQSWDNPLDWTSDGKQVIFASNRNGHYGIFKQSVDGETTEALVAGAKDVEVARVSPDNAWLLYVDSTLVNSEGSLQVMRAPLIGGPSQLVLTARAFSDFRCARSPSTLCVISEATEDRKQFVFTAFDPLQGRESEFARVDIATQAKLFHWDLSPDGTRICIIKNAQAPIEILSLHGDPAQTINVKDWNNLETLNWAADGQGFFISNGVHGGGVLLHVDLRGNANVLRTTPGVGYAPVWPSPDGRHLVIQEFRAEGNIWTLENF